jgi:hypothetical protein
MTTLKAFVLQTQNTSPNKLLGCESVSRSIRQNGKVEMQSWRSAEPQTATLSPEMNPETYGCKEWIIKGKVVSVLFFNLAPRHEGVLGEWRYSFTHSLTSAIDGGEWSASRLSRFTPRERDPGTHWIGGWVSPRAGLEAVVKGKILSPRRESDPRTPIVRDHKTI